MLKTVDAVLYSVASGPDGHEYVIKMCAADVPAYHTRI